MSSSTTVFDLALSVWKEFVEMTLATVTVYDNVTTSPGDLLSVAVSIGCGHVFTAPADVHRLGGKCPLGCPELQTGFEQFSAEAPGFLRLTAQALGRALGQPHPVLLYIAGLAAIVLQANRDDNDSDSLVQSITTNVRMGDSSGFQETERLANLLARILTAMNDRRRHYHNAIPSIDALVSLLKDGPTPDALAAVTQEPLTQTSREAKSLSDAIVARYTAASAPPIPRAAPDMPPTVALMNVVSWLTYDHLDIKYQFLGLVEKLVPASNLDQWVSRGDRLVSISERLFKAKQGAAIAAAAP